MDKDAEVGGAIGRYAAPKIDKILHSVTGAIFILAGLAALGRISLLAFMFLFAGCVFVLASWVLPATVITATGFRRGRFLQLIPWSEVVIVYPPPAGGHIQVQLRTGKVVALDGVKVEHLPEIVALAQGPVTT